MPVVLSNVEWIIFFNLLFIFLGGSVVASVIIIRRVKYPFQATILDDRGDKPFIRNRERAKLIAMGDDGSEIFYLQKTKKYRAGKGKRIGYRNIIWVIGQDDYWYNSDFKKFSKSLLEVGLIPLDRNIRFATSSLRKLIAEKRYAENKTFMEKYGTLLSFGMIFLCIIAFAGVMWFSFNKQVEIANANTAGAEASRQTMELASQVLSSIENIRASGGSGLIPASIGNG